LLSIRHFYLPMCRPITSTPIPYTTLFRSRYMHNLRKDRSHMLRPRELIENSNIGVDTPVPYRASDLIGLIEEYIGKLAAHVELAPYKRLKSRIEMITRDPRYALMFGNLTV